MHFYSLLLHSKYDSMDTIKVKQLLPLLIVEKQGWLRPVSRTV
jgi:hypothetical protein